MSIIGAIKIEDTEDIDFETAWELAHKKGGSKSGETSYTSSRVSSISPDEMIDLGLQPHNSIEKACPPEVLGSLIDNEPRASLAGSIDFESCHISKGPNATTVPNLQAPSIPPAEKSQRTMPASMVETQILLESVVVKEEKATSSITGRFSPSVTKPSSKLDGRLLPFPLGPEAFDNLPLLRQAIKDTEKHLQAMRKRAGDLELKEEQKETYNPWDFI